MTGCPGETKSVAQSRWCRRAWWCGWERGPVRDAVEESESCEMCRWRKDASRGRGSATFEVDVAVGPGRLVIRCTGNLLQGLFHRPQVCGLWVRGRARQGGSEAASSAGLRRGSASQICRRGRTMSPPHIALHWPLQLLHHTAVVVSRRLFFSRSRSQVSEDVGCGCVAADSRSRFPRSRLSHAISSGQNRGPVIILRSGFWNTASDAVDAVQIHNCLDQTGLTSQFSIHLMFFTVKFIRSRPDCGHIVGQRTEGFVISSKSHVR